MGRVLQIRVIAYTFNLKEVNQNWPTLYKIATDDAYNKKEFGLLELIQKVKEKVLFSEDLNSKLKNTLTPYIDKLNILCTQLEDALSNWKPKNANEISYQIEDVLDNAEEAVKEIEYL
ncbi:hypothetical protein [Desulfonauticus submarinus]